MPAPPAPAPPPHLELALGGEDADPAVVVVSDDDVPVHVHRDAGRALQLPGGAAAHTEAQPELPLVGEHLGGVWKGGG